MNKNLYSNQVVNNDGCSPRLFANPILERLSCTLPRTLFFAYAPLVVFFLYQSTRQCAYGKTVLIFCLGIFLWSFVEYLIHRFVFHYVPTQSKWEKINPLFYGNFIHNIHHAYPKDPLRLVTPLVVTLPLAVIFYGLFHIIFASYAPGLFAGFLLGYLGYDLLHAFTHVAPMRSRLGRFLKRYHMQHHYLVEYQSFGVSSPLWDYIFNTVQSKPNKNSK